MVYTQRPGPTYEQLRELLLTLEGINEIYMKSGGVEDLSPGRFRRQTSKLIKRLESDKDGIVLEARLHLAESFPFKPFC